MAVSISASISSSVTAVRTISSDRRHVACGDPAMISNVIQDSDGQFRQRCKRPFFSLNLGGQSAFLLLQSPHQEQ
jgi:membrane-bound lytic murein transglycosylase